jgi:hypothetical protein
MAAVTGTVTEVAPNAGAKMLIVTAPATTDDGDTIAVTLADYGITKFLGILGQTHSTAGSVVITEAPTTAVATGVLTITVGGSTDDKERVFIVWGE